MMPQELRAARVKLNLTKTELGEAVGLQGARRTTQTTVSKWETGFDPIPLRVALLVECFLQGARPSTWPTSSSG